MATPSRALAKEIPQEDEEQLAIEDCGNTGNGMLDWLNVQVVSGGMPAEYARNWILAYKNRKEPVRAVPVSKIQVSAEPMSLAQIERNAVLNALERNGGNRFAAAMELGLAPATINRRLKRWKGLGL